MSLKKVSILLLALSFFVAACDNSDELAEQLDLAKIKLALAAGKANQVPIKEIANTEGVIKLSLEDGEVVEIPGGLVTEMQTDSSTWVIHFTFSDGSTQDAFFVGEFKLEHLDVVLNPYLTAPLSAVATIDVPIPGIFRVAVLGKGESGVMIEKQFSRSDTHHELPILGLYENYANDVVIEFQSPAGARRGSQIVTLATTTISNKPNVAFTIIKKSDNTYRGLYFVSNFKAGFDQNGDLRFVDVGAIGAAFLQKTKNGNYISQHRDGYTISEMNMVGQLVRQYRIANGFHHEIREMPNGNLLIATHTGGNFELEDVIIEVDRLTGAIVKTWDFNNILDPLRKGLPDVTGNDWLHVNAIYFDDRDNSVVISGRSQSAVIKIDYESGAIKWILSHHAGWKESLQPFLLRPVDNAGNTMATQNMDFWPYGQHSPMPVGTNRVLLYDNGDYRNYYDDANVPQASYSRAVEYEINEANMTIKMVWTYDHDKTIFTPYVGSVQQLPSSRLIGFGWPGPNSPRAVEVNASNQVVFEAKAGGNAYRILKFDIYEGL
jgi:arylsulfate sulfotransferase